MAGTKRVKDIPATAPTAAHKFPMDAGGPAEVTSYPLLKAQIIADADGALGKSQRGGANGVAPLDATSRLPAANLPTGITGTLTYLGTVAGNAVPATAAQAGGFLVITSAGTSQGKTWSVGDQAIYSGVSGTWHQVTPAPQQIAQGGTGASTAAGARAALDVYSRAEFYERLQSRRLEDVWSNPGLSGSRLQCGPLPAAAQIGTSPCTIILRLPAVSYSVTRQSGLLAISGAYGSYNSGAGINNILLSLETNGALLIRWGGDGNYRRHSLGKAAWYDVYAGRPAELVLCKSATGFAFWTNGVQIDLGPEFTGGAVPAWTDPAAADHWQIGALWSGAAYGGLMSAGAIINRAFVQADVDALMVSGLSAADQIGGSMITITSGALTPGARYRITVAGVGDTFAGVGASAHTVGHEFICTAPSGATWSNGSQLLQVGALIQPEITRSAQVLDHGPLRIRGLLMGGARPLCTRDAVPLRGTVTATGFFLADLGLWFESGLIAEIRVKPTGASAPTVTVRKDSAAGAIVAAAQSSGTVGSWQVLTLDPAQVEIQSGTKVHVTLSTAQPVDMEIVWRRR